MHTSHDRSSSSGANVGMLMVSIQTDTVFPESLRMIAVPGWLGSSLICSSREAEVGMGYANWGRSP
jgi:hypothetical protein